MEVQWFDNHNWKSNPQNCISGSAQRLNADFYENGTEMSGYIKSDTVDNSIFASTDSQLSIVCAYMYLRMLYVC